MKYRIRRISLYIVLLVPLWSFLFWYFKPAEKARLLILDKTVPHEVRQEHRSLNWILKHKKYTGDDGSFYEPNTDYMGFFPGPGTEFDIRDLESRPREYIDQLGDSLEILFFTDSYGVYAGNWYGKDSINRGLLYGGTTFSDLRLIRAMIERKKPVVAEFNTLGSPSTVAVRRAMEDFFGVNSTEWTGRYFHELDTLLNNDVPTWIPQRYFLTHKKPWDFKGAGIVFAHEDGRILILDKDKLEHEVPVIHTIKECPATRGIPEYIRYPYWIEVSTARKENEVLAQFELHPTKAGDSLLNIYGIPSQFPAVIGDCHRNLRYYFCGDFSDNPINLNSAYFEGAPFLRQFFYNNREFSDRRKFFWELYRPLITNIMKQRKARGSLTFREKLNF